MLDINKDNYHLYINDEWFDTLSKEWKKYYKGYSNQNKKIYYYDNIFMKKSIKIDRENLEDLKGVEYCVNLLRLNCHFNNLTNVENLDRLSKLEILKISSNNIVSLKGLENLVNLKELYTSLNEITSLKGLEYCYNLEKLSIERNKLDYNNLKTYYPLMNCYKLKDIGINVNFYIAHKLQFLFDNILVRLS